MGLIYLIRHGEAEGNLYRIAQGHEDGTLTRRGWEQVRALSRRFEDVPVDVVYSSDLHRACATASAIYKPKGLPLHRDIALREAFLGDWEGRPWGEISRQEPQQLSNFSMAPGQWQVKNAETALQAQQRLEKALLSIAKRHMDETAAVVSHGYAIRMLLGKLQGYTMDNMGTSPQEGNTAVSLLEYDGNALRLIFRGDDSHISLYGSPGASVRHPGKVEGGMYYRQPQSAEDDGRVRAMVRAAAEEAGQEPSEPVDFSLFGLRSDDGPDALLQMGRGGNMVTLYVSPEQRCQGLGVQLIGQAQQWAQSQGLEALYVTVHENSPAIAFLEDCGFIQVADSSEGLIRLEKRLSPGESEL